MMSSFFSLLREHDYFDQTRFLVEKLTPTEQRIAELASCCLTNDEIASQLSISPKTVQNHVDRITEKARNFYGDKVSFRRTVVPRLHTYYYTLSNG
jgi:DNA-binding NarL/FixJ family response regulator